MAISAHVPMGVLVARSPRATVLDCDDLRFTEAEAWALLTELVPAADPSLVAAVAEICEGWAAALVFAADRVRRDPQHATRWLITHGPRLLVGSWFDGLAPELQDFLVDTAALDQLPVGACDAVRTATDSGGLLAAFDASEGPVYRALCHTTAQRPRWRRHRLVTELIRARTTASEHQFQAHSRAADWYAMRGEAESAIHHLLEAGRHEDAAVLVSNHEEEVFSDGGFAVTLDWYQRLASSADAALSEHELRLGWAKILSGDVSGARDSLARLTLLENSEDSLLTAGPLTIPGLSGEIRLLRAQLAGSQGDTRAAVAAASAAAEAFGGSVEQNSHQLAPILLARALLWERQVVQARRVVDDIDASRFPTATLREVSLRGVQAGCAVAEGRITHAAGIIAAGEGWLARGGRDARELRQFSYLTAAAQVQAESGFLPEAAGMIEDVLESTRRTHSLSEYAHATTVQARVLTWQGANPKALDVIRATRDEVASSCPKSGLLSALDQAEAEVLIGAGDFVAAERIVRALPASEQRTVLAGRILVSKQPARVAKVMMNLKPSTPRLAVHRRLILAECYLAANASLSRSHLEVALQSADKLGLQLAIRDHPRLVPDRAPAAPLPLSPGTDQREQMRPLSAGELELLRLLPTRDKNGDIAARLGISVNTVKTRLRRLYKKLDVGNRDDAIATARSRGLL